jgi:hypothetical protein
MSDDEDEERRRRGAEAQARQRDTELGMVGRVLRAAGNWLASVRRWMFGA